MSVTSDKEQQLLDAITSIDKQIQAMDKKLDIYIARTDEKLNGLSKELQTSNNNTEQQLKEIKEQIKSQDNRLWLMISGLFLAFS